LLAQAYNQNDRLSPSWTNMTLLKLEETSSQAVAIIQVALCPFSGASVAMLIPPRNFSEWEVDTAETDQ